MVRGIFPPTANYPQVPLPYQTGTAISSDSDSEFQSVQDAIDATTSGGSVLVGPGVYSEAVVVDVTNLTLIGSGRATLVDTDGEHAVTVTADDVTVQNIAARTSGGSLNSYHAFRTNGAAAGTLFLCWVLGTNDPGLASGGTGFVIPDDGWAVIRGIVEAATSNGIGLSGDGAVVSLCLTKPGVGNHGIAQLAGVDESTIANNVVESPGAVGILTASGSTRTTVAGNQVSSAGTDGVRANGDDERIIGGFARGSADDDLVVSGSDTDIRSFGFSSIQDAGTRTMLNGRYRNPPPLSLGGANGSISPANNDLGHYRLKVDAGGSASNLQGIDSIAEIGTVVTLIHTGGETVTCVDGSGSATNPLKNKGGGNVDLDANDEMIAYTYDGGAWREMWRNLQA